MSSPSDMTAQGAPAAWGEGEIVWLVEMSEGHCGEMVLTNHAVTNRHCLPLIMHLSSAIRKIPSRTRRMGVAANYMI